MTQPIVDARITAWIAAHDRIIGLQKITVRDGKVVDPLPEIYWATLAEAAVLADLAKADTVVGISAGTWITAVEEAKQNAVDNIFGVDPNKAAEQ